MKRILNYLLNKKYLLIEPFLLLCPLLILTPIITQETLFFYTKSILLIYISYIFIKLLIPLLYEGFASNKNIGKISNIFFYIKIIIISFSTVIAIQLVKELIPNFLFIFYLCSLLFLVIKIKATREDSHLFYQISTSLLYFFTVIFTSFYLFYNTEVLPSAIFSFGISFLFVGYITAEKLFKNKVIYSDKILRLPGIFYLLSIAHIGYLAINNLLESIYLSLFILFLLIYRIMPNENNVKDCLKFSNYFFISFIAILCLIRLYLSLMFN